MPLNPEIKTPQGATMVQRGINSFFKSPARPVEEKKGLLNYFQKKSPEVSKQDILTGTNKDEQSTVNENSTKNKSEKKVDNGIRKKFESSPKLKGPTPEGKPSKSKLKRNKKVDVDSQNDKPSVDIENKNHKSKSDEKTKSKLKLSKKADSQNLNTHHDISQEEIAPQIVLKDVTNDSKSNLSNKNNDSIVAEEVDMIEVSVEDKNVSPVKNPGKKALKVKEIEKKDTISPVITKPKSGNAFAFMMSNRHKQDEVIKELEEKEKEDEASSLKSTEEIVKSSEKQKPIDDVIVEDDSEDEQIFTKKTPKENEKEIKGSNTSKSNAFSFLMNNRHKSLGEKETKEIIESNSSSIDSLKKNKKEKKPSKKRKQIADDSVSCDSDLDDNAETKRKKISSEGQHKLDKNKDKKEFSDNQNNSNTKKNGLDEVDITDDYKKSEVNTTFEKKTSLNESDSGQTISFASFIKNKDKIEFPDNQNNYITKKKGLDKVDNTEDNKKSEVNPISENKTSLNESDSGHTISFASFLEQNKKVGNDKKEKVCVKSNKKDKAKQQSSDKLAKLNALKTVRFDNSDDDQEDKSRRESDKNNSKLDSDEDEWDMDSENETRQHETKNKKMKMSSGMFKKQKKSETKSNNVEIVTFDDLKTENDLDGDTPSNVNTDDIKDNSKKTYEKLLKEKEIKDRPDEEKIEVNINENSGEIKTDKKENVDKEPKKKGISNFFKKITKEEQTEARNKNVVTIKADVHATNDGKEEECVGKNVRRSTRRQPKQIEEPVELDKIELLEQVDVSPMKYYRKERIRTLNDTMGDNSASKITTNKDDDRDLDKKEISENQVLSADTKKISPLEKVSSKDASTEIEITESQNKLSEVNETPQRAKRTSAKFRINFDTDSKKSEEEPEESPRRSRRSVSTTPEVDAVALKSKRLRNMLQSPVESTADQEKDAENKNPSNVASARKIASSVSSSGSIDSPVKYTATLDSTPGKLSLKLKKVSKLSKKNIKESPIESQKKLSLSRSKAKIMTPAEMKALLQEVQGDAEDDLDSDDASANKSTKKSRKKLTLKKNSLSPLNKKTRQMLLMSPGLSPKVKAMAKGKNKLPNGSARHQEAVAAKKLRNQTPQKTDEEVGSRRSSRQAVVNVKKMVEISSEDEKVEEKQEKKKKRLSKGKEIVKISSEDEKVEEKQEKKKKRLSKGKDATEKKTVNCLTSFQTPSKKEVILVATPSGKHLRKTTWCGKCAGCKTPNCEKCKHCKNMPKYGGPGTLKKPCKKRKCFNPNISVKAAMDSNKGTKSSSKSLASIFMKKDLDIEIIAVTLSPSKLKARQDFLQSGVPEAIKKKVLIDKKLEEEFADIAVFPSVSHVQQIDTDHWVWNLAHQQVKNLLNESMTPKKIEAHSQSCFMTPLAQAQDRATEDILPQQSQLMDPKTLCSILSGIKKRQPDFPVFAVFKSYLDQKKEAVESFKKELEKDIKSKSVSENDVINLEDEDEEVGKGKRKRRSKGSPVNKKQKLSRSKLKQSSIDIVAENKDNIPIWQQWTPNSWTQMYAPNHSSQVIGNADIVRKMKVWLLEWKKQTESDMIKQKSWKKKAKREDDFLCSDESSGWEEDDGLANTLLLAGIPGVGKTAAVYALAQELGYKVLEVNASSHRKGLQVMKQLAEATQSHSMSGGNSSQGNPVTPVKNTLATMFASKQKKKKKEKVLVPKEDGQNSSVEKEKKMAMVLFEDIDIVFDEDDGFIMAVNNIMAETKRPIILTTTYLTPNILSKIKGNFEYLTFTAPSNDLVCQHLELMALSGGVAACREDLRWLLEHFRGDIRQAILTLQSWLLTGSSHTSCVSGSEYKLKSPGDTTEELKCNVKEITLKEVFPDTKETLLREVYIQRGSLFGHLSINIGNNTDMTSVYRLPWTKLFINLPRLLPLHSVEKVIGKRRYPLNQESDEVKTSVLYKKASWLSFDDDSDDEKSEVPAEVPQNAEEETTELKTDATPDVIQSSKLCIESISSFSSTLCDLDILSSIPEMGALVSRESDFEWRSWQPTPGLSDGYCTDKDWSSQSFVTDLSNDLSCRAMDHCSMKVKDALKTTSTPDHPQLCFSLAEPTCKSLTLLPREPQCDRDIKHLERISLLLPVAGQQNKTNLGCDYFPVLRQIARYDELGAALSHKRRGRRFLSYLSGIGIHLDPAEKITMANTLLD